MSVPHLAVPAPRLDVAAPSWWGRRRDRLRSLALVAVSAGLLAVVLPRMVGGGWGQWWGLARTVPAPVLVGLAALWAGGLALHTIALRAALPGLTTRRAATLSLTGSAVANVLPAGGAAGVLLNVRMGRRWGHGGAAMSTYTVLTNLGDVAMKVALPIVLLPVLLTSGLPSGVLVSLGATAAIGLVVLLLAIAVIRGRVPLRGPLARLAPYCEDAARSLGRASRGLGVGLGLYTVSLLALMAGCLAAVGATLPLGVLLAAFTLERLVTLAGITPGGSGLVEVALSALLVSTGSAGAAAISGMLLYRAFTFAAEIPVGGAWLAGWLWSTRRADRRAPVAAVDEAPVVMEEAA